MRCFLGLILDVLLTVSCLCYAQEVKSGRYDSAARSTMTGVMKKAPFSGSLEYWGDCGMDQEAPVLPEVRTPAGDGASPSALVMLREMFENDPKMQVTGDADGTIRIIQSDVPKDLLNVTIRKISFTNVYDPETGTALIFTGPEVRAFMKAHGIWSYDQAYRFHVANLNRQAPVSGLPHISESLENVTVQQALDRLLKTFPGFWIYENCRDEKGGRVIAYSYFGGP